MSTIPAGIGHAGRRASVVLSAALGLLLISHPAHGYEHRKSTPSFGVQIGYGRLVAGDSYRVTDWPWGENGRVTRRFSLHDTHNQFGPSIHVGLRFVLDRNHAAGFGFDDLRYPRKSGYTVDQRAAIPKWVKFTTFHGDYYLYFRRRMQVSYTVAPFVGMQQRELRFKGSDVRSSEYKLLYGITLGVEYFVRRTFSVDVSGRLFGLRGGTKTNVLLQPAVGIHLYVI